MVQLTLPRNSKVGRGKTWNEPSGDGEWKDTSVVADDVQIKFRIVTPVKKG